MRHRTRFSLPHPPPPPPPPLLPPPPPPPPPSPPPPPPPSPPTPRPPPTPPAPPAPEKGDKGNPADNFPFDPAHPLRSALKDEHALGASAQHWIYNALPAAVTEAKRTNKPIFVTFRCVPCKACNSF